MRFDFNLKVENIFPSGNLLNKKDQIFEKELDFFKAGMFFQI